MIRDLIRTAAGVLASAAASGMLAEAEALKGAAERYSDQLRAADDPAEAVAALEQIATEAVTLVCCAAACMRGGSHVVTLLSAVEDAERAHGIARTALIRHHYTK